MSNPVSSANREGYDRWSAIYDGYVNSTVFVDDATFPPVWQHLIGQRVLEIGCGTGRHTLRLAQQGNIVTGIDLSPGMLTVAREKLSGFSTVTLIEGDIYMADVSGFDAVVTALVLEHIGDLNTFFSQVFKFLVAEGSLFLSEIHPDRIAGGTQANFIDSATGEAVRLTSFAHTEADIQAAAELAGLRLVAHRDIIGDDSLPHHNPDWQRHVGKPMIRIWTFSKGDHP